MSFQAALQYEMMRAEEDARVNDLLDAMAIFSTAEEWAEALERIREIRGL